MAIIGAFLILLSVSALPADAQDTPKSIIVGQIQESLEDRLERKISLNVRDMSIIDVIKFLAEKGELNLISASNIQGRATFLMKSVSIKDALDIAVISNRLAYKIENDIIQVMTEQEYEAAYGKKFNDRMIVEIVHLEYAKPAYVLSTLDSVKSALGRIIIDEDTGSVVMIDTPESIAEMKKILKNLEVSVKSFTYRLQYANAETVAEKLRARVEAHAVGSITVDERTNSIIVRALPERRKEVERLIKELDTPTKEVMVEARVIQINFKPQFDLGIDWNLDFRSSDNKFLRRTSFNNIFLDESSLSSSDQLFANFTKVGIGDFSQNQFATAIRALKQVSDTKILSNPKLLVTNNQEARIHVGDTIPYIISTTSGTGDNAITSEDVRFVDVGIKLNVTPTINDDGFVTMLLNPEISTVVGSIESQGGGIPQVSKTEVETTVMVKDGQTIVLGGLRKDNKSQIRKGVPGLMDVPVIKRFFSSTSDEIESTEIVIFITPHIVSGSEEYKDYKGEIKPLKELSQDKDIRGQQALQLKD